MIPTPVFPGAAGLRINDPSHLYSPGVILLAFAKCLTDSTAGREDFNAEMYRFGGVRVLYPIAMLHGEIRHQIFARPNFHCKLRLRREIRIVEQEQMAELGL